MSKKVSTPPTKTPTKSATPPDNQLKEETLRWMLSIFCSAVLYALVAYIISTNYHPDIQSLLDSITKISFAGNPKPEPMESLLVKTGMVCIPAFLLGFYFLFSKTAFIKKTATSNIFNVVTTFFVLIVIVIIYKDYTSPNPCAAQPENLRDMEGKTNFEFFFKGLFLDKHLFLYSFLIVPLVYAIFMVGLKKMNWEKHRLYNYFFLIPGNLFVAAVILSIVLMNVYHFPYTYENKYDFNAFYYSLTQVNAGSPLLIDGFTNTYGLYPHFLNLIFSIIGLSVIKLTAVLTLLLVFTFSINFFFLKRYVSNKIILYLGILTVIYIPYYSHFFLLRNFDSAFSFFPLRYIIPSSLLFLTGMYLPNRSKMLYWLTFCLMGISVLWNPEIGLVCYIAWVATNIYYDFYDENKKINFKKIVLHLVIGAILILAIFNLYKLIIYVTYGAVPDLSLLFTYIFLFGKTGFAALPMTLIHPWNILVIVYMISMLYPIIKFLQKDITPKAVIILLMSILGFGFFLYFQGRSHNFQLLNASITCLILIILLGDMLWEKIKSNNIIALNVLFFVFVYIITFSFFEIASQTKKVNELMYQKSDIAKGKVEQNRIESNEQFILRNTKPGEKIHTLTAWHYQGLYFNGNKRKSAFNPGLLEMVLYSDLKRMEKIITDSSFTAFFEPELCNYHFMQRPIAALSCRYKILDGNLSMARLKPYENKIPEPEFFKPDNTTFLHSKYTSDSTGVKARVNDSEGIKILSLPQEFSVELLFHPQQQVYQYATLISNMTDSAGIMVANERGTDKYYFGINGKSFILPVINNGWVYVVMNVFSNRVELFQNGALSQTIPLREPYKNPYQKMYVGNIGAWRYYFGQIAEVSIKQKPLTNIEVQSKWLEIDAVCKDKKYE